jgi:hypothetical protein
MLLRTQRVTSIAIAIQRQSRRCSADQRRFSFELHAQIHGRQIRYHINLIFCRVSFVIVCFSDGFIGLPPTHRITAISRPFYWLDITSLHKWSAS